MRRRVVPRRTIATLAVLVACALSTRPASALDVRAMAIDHFATLGMCGGGDRTWSEMIGNWYSMMAVQGHTLSGFTIDGNFNRGLLCDPDTGLAGCQDFNYVDGAKAVMIGLHGASRQGRWRGTMLSNGGPAINDCYIEAPDASGHGEFFVGDNDAEFLHLSSCQGMTDHDLPNKWRLFEDPVDSPKNGRRLHEATGFHGMMGIGPGYDSDYSMFAITAQFVSIKDAWMDTMHHPNMENQKCPVAYAIGTSTKDCFHRIDNETYKNVFSDPGPINTYCYYYYDKCDPAAGSPFTPPQ